MTWSPKYLEASLFYEAWKTKFIEAFTVEFINIKKEFQNLEWNNNEQLANFVEHFTRVYKLVLQILKKKLSESGNKNLCFNKDIIQEAWLNGLIKEKLLYFEILTYLNENFYNPESYKNFKPQFMDVFNEFNSIIKPLIKTHGFKDPEYAIYDNSDSLWGLEKKYYLKIIKLFLKYDTIKVVRICGSRVTKDYREFSDIDLICEGTYNNYDFMNLQNQLYELEIPYAIDAKDVYQKNKPFIYRNLVKSNIFYDRSWYYEDNYKSPFIY